MHLSVFIYSVEGVGPRNVCPNKTLGPSVINCLSYLPVNLCICITGYIISAITYAVKTEREWQTNINNQVFLPGIVELLLKVV